MTMPTEPKLETMVTILPHPPSRPHGVWGVGNHGIFPDISYIGQQTPLIMFSESLGLDAPAVMSERHWSLDNQDLHGQEKKKKKERTKTRPVNSGLSLLISTRPTPFSSSKPPPSMRICFFLQRFSVIRGVIKTDRHPSPLG